MISTAGAMAGEAAVDSVVGKEENERPSQIKDPNILDEAELTKLIAKLSTIVPEFAAKSIWRGRSGNKDAPPGAGNEILSDYGNSTLNVGDNIGEDEFEIFRSEFPAGLKCLAYLNAVEDAGSMQEERASLTQALLAMPTSITGLYEPDEAVSKAIEIVKKDVIRSGETFLKAWPLQAINAAGKVEERLCVLTSHAWYKLSFNYERMESKNIKRKGLEDINEIFVGEERGWTMIDKVMTLNKKSEDSEPKASRRFGVQVVYSWEVKREGIMGAIASSAARVVGGDFISNPLKGFKRMFDWVPGFSQDGFCWTDDTARTFIALPLEVGKVPAEESVENAKRKHSELIAYEVAYALGCVTTYMTNIRLHYRLALEKRMCFPSATAYSQIHNAGVVGKAGMKSHELKSDSEDAVKETTEAEAADGKTDA